jgi:hypothetical protein
MPSDKEQLSIQSNQGSELEPFVDQKYLLEQIIAIQNKRKRVGSLRSRLKSFQSTISLRVAQR